MSVSKIYQLMEKHHGDIYSAPLKELKKALRDPKISRAKVSAKTKSLMLSIHMCKAADIFRANHINERGLCFNINGLCDEERCYCHEES